MTDISVLRKKPMVEMYPYPHVQVVDALPDHIYNELEATFPQELVTSTEPHDNGITYRYKADPALTAGKLPPIWQEFFEYHTSAEYFREVAQLFEPALQGYPDLFEKMMTRSVTPRGVDNSGDFVTDCQFVVHEPLNETTTSRTPHLDNPVEIYAGLLYMRQPGDFSLGGNFTLHDIQGDIKEVNKALGRHVHESFHNPVHEVPYQRNTFCMFLNVPNSVHSVTPRSNPIMRRHSVNIIGEFNGNGRMWKVKEIK